MNFDEYGEICNGAETYEATAEHLKHSNKPALLGWTDGSQSHYDILISNGANVALQNMPCIQGGIRQGDLFVSVMRVGAFGFKVTEGDLAPAYVGEKLGMSHEGPTIVALTELLNQIIKRLL